VRKNINKRSDSMETAEEFFKRMNKDNNRKVYMEITKYLFFILILIGYVLYAFLDFSKRVFVVLYISGYISGFICIILHHLYYRLTPERESHFGEAD